MKCLVKPYAKTGVVSRQDVNIVDFVKNPSLLPKKDLPLWRFCELKDDAPLIANQLNYTVTRMIILEFDHSVSIQDVENRASKYTYALHTTSNHTNQSHRFRLMLPLDKDYPDELWRSRYVKIAMLGLFPGLDATCFVNYQCIPALPNNPQDYYCSFNNGIRFGYDCISEKVIEMEFDDQLAEAWTVAHRKTFNLTDESKQKYHDIVLESLQRKYGGCGSSQTGHRYSDLCSYAGALCNAKDKLTDDWVFNKIEIEQLIKCEYWDTAIAKMVRAFLSRRKY
jgi:Zn ribbon nucleic-acid-binding protein